MCAQYKSAVVSKHGVVRSSEEGDSKKRLREEVGCELRRRRSGSNSARILVGVDSIASMQSWEGAQALYALKFNIKSAQMLQQFKSLACVGVSESRLSSEMLACDA